MASAIWQNDRTEHSVIVRQAEDPDYRWMLFCTKRFIIRIQLRMADQNNSTNTRGMIQESC